MLLRDWMKEQPWTIEGAADAVGVGATTYSSWMYNRRGSITSVRLVHWFTEGAVGVDDWASEDPPDRTPPRWVKQGWDRQ